MVLVLRMDCVYESAMLLRLAVSAVHAARSILRMTVGTTVATRTEITATTPIISIKVNAAPDAPTFLSAAMSLALTPFGNFRDESQRDSDSKPKVARNELPWETRPKANNPKGVTARQRRCGATPLGLKATRPGTQGSSFLATLG